MMIRLTAESLSNYVDHLKQRQKQDTLLSQKRYQEGWKQAKKAANILKIHYNVKQVCLFGSLLSPESIHANSDIDLAVTGLSLKQYCDAVGTLLVEIHGFNIDLVRLETASQSLKKYIINEGVEL